MIQILWEFVIQPDKRAEFEQYYAAEGHWARLFQQSSAYRGTTLAQDIERTERYLITDVWENLEAFSYFKKMFGDDYERLDKLCEQFTVEERRLGIFKVVLPSTAGEYFLMEERILTQHPQGKQGVSISKTKYDLVRDAIIESLQDKELTFVDLNEVVANKLADKFEGSISWYVTTVKLDLEAQKIIERVSKTTPQRLRLAVK